MRPVRAFLFTLALLCAAPALATNDTFDTDSVATAGITFSNGNLTALASSGNLSNSSIAQTIEGKTSGQWYVEFTCVAVSGNTDGAGIVTAVGVGQNGFVGQAIGWGYFTNGNVVNGGSGVTAVNNTTYGAGDIIGVAIDLTNKKIWFRKNTGSWIGTGGTPNPATNTSGFDLTATVAYGRIYPAANMAGNLAKFTANFGATSFTGSVPSGFNSGWTNTTAGTYFGTFATTGKSAGLTSAPPTGDKAVSAYTATLTGSVISIVLPFSGAATCKGVIYADSSGSPGALIAVSGNAISGTGEQAFTFTGVNVVSGTKYWVGIVSSGSGTIQTPPLPNGIQYNSGTYASPTNPFGTPTTANFRYPAIINVLAASSARHKLLLN